MGPEKNRSRNQNSPLPILGKTGSVCNPPEDPLFTKALHRFLSLSHKSDPLWHFPSLSTLRVGIILNIKTSTSKNSFLERGLDSRYLQELPSLGLVSPKRDLRQSSACREEKKTQSSGRFSPTFPPLPYFRINLEISVDSRKMPKSLKIPLCYFSI